MILDFNTHRVRTLKDLHDFMAGSESFDFKPVSRLEVYCFIEATLTTLGYPDLGRADKGAVKAYLHKATDLSRAQLTRLIRQWRDTGTLRDHRGMPGKPYSRRYTEKDVALLAKTDRLYEVDWPCHT